MRPSCLALLLALETPDKGFVRFHDLARAAHGRKAARAKGFTQAMHHEPARLVADAKRAMDLVSRDALLRGRKQEQRGKPFGQRNLAALENGFNGHRELLTAFGALV